MKNYSKVPKTALDVLRVRRAQTNIPLQSDWTPDCGLWSPKRLLINTTHHKKDELLIGIELEFECASYDDRQQALELIDTYLPGASCCSDGSLNADLGIEVNTPPMSVSEFRSLYINYYKLLTALTALGCKSHDSGNCGLHVHVSRGYFGSDSYAAAKKMESLIFTKRGKTFFQEISRRLASKYRPSRDYDDPFYFCQFSANPSPSRYGAVNIQPQQTIEFRFFRGTLKPASFFASIEVLIWLTQYVKVSSNPTLPQFLRFCKASTSPLTLSSYAYLQATYTALFPAVKRNRRTKAELLEAKKVLYSSFNDYIKKIASKCIESRGAIVLDYSDYNTNTSDYQLHNVQVPIELSGRFSNALLKFADETRPTVTLPILHNSKSPLPSLVVHASLRRGWGREHLITNIFNEGRCV